MNLERVEHWLAKGAQPTDTTRQLIKRYSKAHQPAAESPAVPEPAAEAAAPPADEPKHAENAL